MNEMVFQDAVDGIMIERYVRDFDFNMMSDHIHNEYEIYYLLDGERNYFIEKQTYLVKKGSLVFIERNQVHKTGTASSDFHDRILLFVKGEEIEKNFPQLRELNIANCFKKCFGVLELTKQEQKYVEHLLFLMMDEMKEKPTGYEFTIKSKLMELLIFSVRCVEKPRFIADVSIVQTAKHKKIHEVADYIVKNYNETKSLDELSKQFFVSKSYLSRIFKDVTGFTVNEYINLNRIKQAQILLENKSYNITEISELVGYDSITYFEKVFKKYMEISPLKYRKKINKISTF